MSACLAVLTLSVAHAIGKRAYLQQLAHGRVGFVELSDARLRALSFVLRHHVRVELARACAESLHGWAVQERSGLS